MSSYTPHDDAYDGSARLRGELPFDSHRPPPRIGGPARVGLGDGYDARSDARDRLRYRLALAVGWSSTVVIPAVVTLYHQAFITMLGHLLARIVQH